MGMARKSVLPAVTGHGDSVSGEEPRVRRRGGEASARPPARARAHACTHTLNRWVGGEAPAHPSLGAGARLTRPTHPLSHTQSASRPLSHPQHGRPCGCIHRPVPCHAHAPPVTRTHARTHARTHTHARTLARTHAPWHASRTRTGAGAHTPARGGRAAAGRGADGGDGRVRLRDHAVGDHGARVPLRGGGPPRRARPGPLTPSLSPSPPNAPVR
jgi:hypothetical protein